MRMLLQVNQLVDDSLREFVRVLRRQVRQSAMLAPAPDQFIGIEFRGIGRQVVQRQAAPPRGDKLPDY